MDRMLPRPFDAGHMCPPTLNPKLTLNPNLTYTLHLVPGPALAPPPPPPTALRTRHCRIGAAMALCVGEALQAVAVLPNLLLADSLLLSSPY